MLLFAATLVFAACGDDGGDDGSDDGGGVEVTTLAGLAGTDGSTDGNVAQARFFKPWGIATDDDNLYVTDAGNHTIRMIK